MKDKKKLLLVIGALLSVIVIIVGVSYAFFNYAKLGSTENSITSGTITFLYTEVDKVGAGIKLENAIPITDTAGKMLTGSGNVFNFKVTSTTNMDAAIPYEVTARMKEGSDLDPNVVKVYLTKGETEEEVLLDKYSNLIQTSRVSENVAVEKTIYNGRVPSNTSNYEETFKLRMWVDSETDFSPVEENGEVVYPYNNKTFTLMVNVYADAKIVSQEEIDMENSTKIETVTAGDTTLTEVTGEDYQYEATLPEGTTQTTLNIETVNPNSTVEIERIDSLAINESKSNVSRLSTAKTVSLTAGENYFNIRILSENKKIEDEYILMIKVGNDNVNTLKNLSVSGYSISPEFSEDILEYTVTLEEINIIINAESASSAVDVVGAGTKTLSWGTNTFSIIVTAQDGTTKTYMLTVNNQRPIAPIITGGTGSDNWTNNDTTISVATVGTAISNIKNYEYYTTTSTTTPTDSTEATGTTSGDVTISTEGKTYVYYRTVSNNGNKSLWSSPQIVKIDKTGPEVTYTATISSNSIQLTMNASDNLSGSFSHSDVKYSDTEGIYTNSASYNGSWMLNDLNSTTTYYFKYCVTDKAGNETCIKESVTTASLETPTLLFTNTPTTPQNGYLLKQTATISGTSSKYYYVKTTKWATSSVSTTYSCGTDTVPGTCTSGSSSTTLNDNTWYRYSSKPIITYANASTTSTGTIYVAIGDDINISETASGIVSPIDGASPIINLNRAYFNLKSSIIVSYTITDALSGIADYTCEYTGYSSSSVSSSGASTSGTSISSSGVSSGGTPLTAAACEINGSSVNVSSSSGYRSVGYKICATDKVGNTTSCITGTVEIN